MVALVHLCPEVLVTPASLPLGGGEEGAPCPLAQVRGAGPGAVLTPDPGRCGLAQRGV